VCFVYEFQRGVVLTEYEMRRCAMKTREMKMDAQSAQIAWMIDDRQVILCHLMMHARNLTSKSFGETATDLCCREYEYRDD
jgi:hypothetical protein